MLSPNTAGEDCSKQINQDVLDKIIYYTSHYLMEAAVKDVENNNITSAKQKLEQGKNLISNSTNSKPPPYLLSQYKAMDDYQNSLADWHTKSEENRKHVQKNAHYNNYKIRKQRKS